MTKRNRTGLPTKIFLASLLTLTVFSWALFFYGYRVPQGSIQIYEGEVVVDALGGHWYRGGAEKWFGNHTLNVKIGDKYLPLWMNPVDESASFFDEPLIQNNPAGPRWYLKDEGFTYRIKFASFPVLLDEHGLITVLELERLDKEPELIK